MIDIKQYLQDLSAQLHTRFGKRLLYMGLQGSYQRGEAGENSDIDIMVLLDALRAQDFDLYREALEAVGHAELACGFIAGKEDMQCWNALEICHLLHTTQDYYGRLACYVPQYTRGDVVQFVKLSIGNLYHGLCHHRIHAPCGEMQNMLAGAYKSAFFILQNLHYLESGDFITTRAALKAALTGDDRAVMEQAQGTDDEAFSLLLNWCQQAMKRADGLQ